MISLFKRKGAPEPTGRRRPTDRGRPSGPEGARLYAIGDVHGRADLLAELHGQIREDAADYGGRKVVVYLGDYVDRGLQSRQVVELLLEPELELPGFETVFLKGNHEQAMLDFMDYPEATAGWLSFGGRETLMSYGINVTFIPLMKDMQKLADELAAALPESHRQFLEDGLLSWREGDYYFVHAGIRPGVDLDDQHVDDQLWIREEFIASEADHGAVVVHGHTISEKPEIRANRIGLDTGAFHSGVLTCLVIEGEATCFLQTGS